MPITDTASADASTAEAVSAVPVIPAGSEPAAVLAAAPEQEREPLEQLARAQARADRIQAMLDPAAENRLRATARSAKTARMRLEWLQRAADVVGRAVKQAGGIACRKQ
jgi:hypothetical protein